jgi:PAS domain S-box-containing protein
MRLALVACRVGSKALAMNTNPHPNSEAVRDPTDDTDAFPSDASVPPTDAPEGAPDGRLEVALHHAQANLLRYQNLFDFAPDAYLVTDLHAVIQEANHAAAALFCTRKEFLVNKPLMFYVTDRDRQTFAANLLRLALPGENQLRWEMSLSRPRADPVYTLVTAVAPWTAGRLSTIRWTFKDITYRRQLEETLRAEKEFSDTLVEMATALILVLGDAGRIRRVNAHVCELTGRWPGELVGRAFAGLFVEEDRPSARRALDGLVVHKSNARGVHRLRTKDGQTRSVAWSARILPEIPGEERQVLFVGNDVTDLQEAQQRALQAERLAAIGQMATGLAHESRNCLQRTQACLEMLGLRLTDNREAVDLLERAQRAQDDLQRLFEEVRDYAAPIRLELHRCRLEEVWRQAWDDLSPAHAGKDARLAEEGGDINLEVMGSPFHLRQVFRNLFENSLGAAASRVTVRCKPAEFDGREAVRVAVQDNGTGFAEEKRKRAFEDFFTTKVHGTGLGLAICKRIVEAHGGWIVLGEPAGPGAVVVITLPRRPTLVVS